MFHAMSVAAVLLGASEADAAAPPQDEVVVVGKKEADAPTEMKKDTEQLLSVAGAANDPLQAIYTLPGVTFSASDGPGGSEPVIRGSAPTDNAYFVDLIPASYIFHLFGNSIFDKHVIHSFDLYPAAFSSKYGNATGGIIDVTLREPRSESFATTLHTSLLTAGALVETKLGENQALYGTYRRSTMDLLVDEEDITDDDDEGLRIDEMPVSDDYQLKYSWKVNESNNLSFVAAGASDSLKATFEENHEEALRDPDFAGPASLEQGFDSQGLVWNWRGEGRELTGIVSHIDEHNSLIYGRDQHEKTDSNRLLSRVLFTQKLNERHALSAGASLQDITYDLDFNAKLVACNDLDPECSTVDAAYVTYRDRLKVLAHEAYLEDRWSLTAKQAITFGLHYGSDDYLGDGRVEPRLRYDYQFTDRLSTYAAAGRYSQLPRLREMIDVLGNPGLTTVKADHYVWGVNHQLGNGWRWGADLYYKDLTDVVISAEQDAAATRYSNGAEGSAYGVEFLVRKDLTDRWHGWASLSLAESDRTNTLTGETVRFEYDKPILFNLVANRQIGKWWTMGFRWTYQSGGRYTPIIDLAQSATHPNVLEPVYGELNSQKYPDFHRLDLRAEYTRPKRWGYWKFYVDVLNAYDQDNVASYEYAPNGRKLIAPPPGFGAHVPVTRTLGDSLFPSIGFEVQFK
jgi:outer membrane receptor for ferrienterochelin and colicin